MSNRSPEAQRFVLIGHPVSHSVSPQIHAAAYRQFGAPHEYVAVDCPDLEAVRVQCERLRVGEIAGANITIPYKREALRLADTVDESARATGAANVWVRNAEGRIVAYNTDAAALEDRLRIGLTATGGAQEPSSFAATVLGSGGAALASVVALRSLGAARTFVSSRKWTEDASLWAAADEFRALGATPVTWREVNEGGVAGEHGVAGERGGSTPSTVVEAASASRLIVQASSAGMLKIPDPESVCRVIPWSKLAPNTFLYDVVYNPPVPPFLEVARRVGMACEGGLSMLVGQAARAIQLWLGKWPEQEPMQRAAHSALFGSSAS